MTVPFRLHTDYNISPMGFPTDPNRPPVLRLFDEKGPSIQGPMTTLAKAMDRTTSVSAPLQLPLWVTDDAHYSSGSNAPLRNPPPPVEFFWTKFRGPGHRDLREGAPAGRDGVWREGGRTVCREGHHDGQVQRAR